MALKLVECTSFAIRISLHRSLFTSGYFVETDRQASEVPTPFVGQSRLPRPVPLTAQSPRTENNPPRSLGTSIYYLLTHDDPKGVIHMNKSVVRSLSNAPLLDPSILSFPHRPTMSSTAAAPNTPSSTPPTRQRSRRRSWAPTSPRAKHACSS